jgi:Ca2+-binding EF-hand superfamily protein
MLDLDLTTHDSEIKIIFNLIDTDHDGFISETEWRKHKNASSQS